MYNLCADSPRKRENGRNYTIRKIKPNNKILSLYLQEMLNYNPIYDKDKNSKKMYNLFRIAWVGLKVCLIGS